MRSIRTLMLALLALSLLVPALAASSAKATFAGGCFWCMEDAFEKLPGVVRHVGLHRRADENPTYEQVSAGGPDTPKPSRCTSTRRRSPTRSSSRSTGRTSTRRSPTASSATTASSTAPRSSPRRRPAAGGRGDQEAGRARPKVPIATQIVKAASSTRPRSTTRTTPRRIRWPTTSTTGRKNCGRADLLEQIWARSRASPRRSDVIAAVLFALAIAAAAGPPTPAASKAWNPATFVKPPDAELQESSRRSSTRSPSIRAPSPRSPASTPTPGAGIYVDVVSGEPLFSSLDKYDPARAGRASRSRSTTPTSRRDRRQRSSCAHRGALGARRLPPRPRLRRRPAADGLRYCMNSARCASSRPTARGRGLRRVPKALREIAAPVRTSRQYRTPSPCPCCRSRSRAASGREASRMPAERRPTRCSR